MKSERVGGEDDEGHGVWVAMTFRASQPTLALGRQTSNCHVGQDYAEELLPVLPDCFRRKWLVRSGT